MNEAFGWFVVLAVLGVSLLAFAKCQSDCYQKHCKTGSPIYLHRDNACICAEVPK